VHLRLAALNPELL
jgi:hypothetical protein